VIYATDFEMASGKKMHHDAHVEADTAKLRYHLTSLYGLRPLPDDMLTLVEQIGARVEGAHAESD
jgi:hypothetical protein